MSNKESYMSVSSDLLFNTEEVHVSLSRSDAAEMTKGRYMNYLIGLNLINYAIRGEMPKTLPVDLSIDGRNAHKAASAVITLMGKEKT